MSLKSTLALGLTAVFAVSGAAVAQVHLDAAGFSSVVPVLSWRDIPFRTVVRQKYDFSCGSAALATLLTYQYNMPTSEDQAFKDMYATGDQAKIRRLGFSLLDMKRYLKSHGVRSDGFRYNLDDLGRLNLPAIALISLGRYRHFVVIKGVANGKVLVGDPALGLKTYAQSDFAKMWNGISFVVDPTPEAPKASFNVAKEWSPWARAPTGAIGGGPLAELTRNLAPTYQLTPVLNVPGPVAGGVP